MTMKWLFLPLALLAVAIIVYWGLDYFTRRPIPVVNPPPIVTPAPKPAPAQTPTVEEPKPAVSRYHQFLLDNPEASEGFTVDEYEFAEEHLKRTPELMADPEFYEAFNAKIMIEEDMLKRFGKSHWPPTDKDWTEIILTNWDYVYHRLHKGGESYGAISKSELEERVPEEKDRELYYMGLWVPNGLKYKIPLPDWGEWLTTVRVIDNIPYENSRLHPTPLSWGRDTVVYNLKNMSTLASNIVQVRDDPDLFLYGYAERIVPNIGIQYHGNSRRYCKKYLDFYKASGDEELKLAILIHGIAEAIYSHDDVEVAQVLGKSLGIVFYRQFAPYGHGIPTSDGRVFIHGIPPAFTVPKSILDTMRAHPETYGTPLIGPGQSIGWVPNLEAVEEDGLPWVSFILPDRMVIVHLDESYDLDQYLRKVVDKRKLKIWTREDLGYPFPQAPNTNQPTSETPSLSLDIVSITSPVNRGEKVTLVVRTLPGANCTLTMGRLPRVGTKDLLPKKAGSDGEVSWTWEMGTRVSPGDWRITVQAHSRGSIVTESVDFSVIG